MSDEIFQDAVEALREGNKSKARDLVTGLLKTDQSNATYWVWMSATVDSTKERIYCLQTAYKLDPENATAKRGFILLGALPPDETVQPFSLNRPRVWEEKLLLAHEKPKPKGIAALRASPVFRLGGIAVLSAGESHRGGRWPALGAGAVACQHLAGDPQWTMVAVGLGLLLALGRAWAADGAHLRGAARALAAVVFGTGLAAVQLVPAWALLGERCGGPRR